jgi:chorismate mutase/prephenate dehydratase
VIAAEKKARASPCATRRGRRRSSRTARALIRDPEIEGYYVRFLQEVIDLSCRYQTRLLDGMRVTTAAWRALTPRSPRGRCSPARSSSPARLYRGLSGGGARRGGLRRAAAGKQLRRRGGAVMDLMFSGSLYINQVLDLPIEHC